MTVDETVNIVYLLRVGTRVLYQLFYFIGNSMKLLVKPEYVASEIEIPEYSFFQGIKHMLGYQAIPTSVTRHPGRVEVSNIVIDDPNQQIQDRKQDLELDGYQIFGLFPVERQGDKVTCVVDHFLTVN